MVRMFTQLLVGLMLFFGVMTLVPKAIIEYRSGKIGKSVMSSILAGLALFFSCMAFYYAYLLLKELLAA